MSEETKVNAPPATAPLSPEKQQMNAIQDAKECCLGILDILKNSVGLTVSNFNQLHKFVAWLQNIEFNLDKDWTDLYSKVGPEAPAPLKVVVSEELANEVVGENPTL